MRTPRIYLPQALEPGREIELPAQAGEHIARVLRLEPGHPLRLFNGDGHEYASELATIAKRVVTARVLSRTPADRESPLKITLGQGIARGDKMDFILQKATELGVARIVPLITARTEVKLDAQRAERRLAHWHAVITAACEQCGRNRLPDLEPPIRLANWAAAIATEGGLRLSLDPHGDVAARTLPAIGAVTLAVGPEGGFAMSDHASLQQSGFRGLRLGPRILRTETAGLAAVAAMQAIHGDL